MPRRKGRQQRRRRGGGSQKPEGLQRVVEHVTFSIPIGTTTPVRRSDLKSVPDARAFKVTHVRADVTGGHWYLGPGGTTANPTPPAGGYYPTWLQLRLYDPTGARAVSTSGAHMLGPNPRSVNVTLPPGTDWTPLESKADQTIMAIDCACVNASRPTGLVKTFAAGVLHLTVLLDVEESAEACPTLTSLPPFSEDFEVIHTG